MDYQIRPDGRELLAAAHEGGDASAKRKAARIYLDAFGLRFEILPGDIVRGPYCVSCRRIQGHAAFTDWSTSERAQATTPSQCAHCGAGFAAPTHDLAALFRLVHQLFADHVARLRHELGTR